MAGVRAGALRRIRVEAAARTRQGARRVRGSFVPILQSAAGAAIAWLIARYAFGQPNPIFAPIATWVCLGFKRDRQPRKVAELGAGATLGVTLGDWAARYLDVGWWQLVLVLAVAALLARFLDRGELFTIQSAVNAMVILSMSTYEARSGGISGRGIDALTGALVAFVIAVLLPRDVVSRPRRYGVAVLTDFARALRTLAEGLRASDPRRLDDATVQLRTLAAQTSAWEETLATARDVVQLNPTLRRAQPEVFELARLHRLCRRAQRSAAMVARQSLGMTEEVGGVPHVADLVADAADAAESLAEATHTWVRPLRARELLAGVAARCSPGDLDTSDWRPVALMASMRSLTVDLLQMSGLSRADARSHLVDTWGLTHAVDEPIPPERDDDDSSQLWA